MTLDLKIATLLLLLVETNKHDNKHISQKNSLVLKSIAQKGNQKSNLPKSRKGRPGDDGTLRDPSNIDILMVFHIFCGRIFSDSQMNVTQVNMDIGNYHFYRLTLPLGVWQARDKNCSQYSHILPGVFYWRPSIQAKAVKKSSVLR